MNLNARSPFPLWAVMAIGGTLLTASYILGAVGIPKPPFTVLSSQTGATAPEHELPSQTSVFASATAASPLITSLSNPAGATTSTRFIDTSGWTTYRNDRYKFDVQFPRNWNTYTRGEGEYGATSGNEARFSISPTLPEDGIFVTVYTLGSDSLGPYRAATSVDAYVQLLKEASTRSSGIFTEKAMDLNIGGRRSVSFQSCSAYLQCFLETFFQDGQQIYQISKPAPLDESTFVKILSTWRFGN